jgi:hypothetical protein
LQTPLYIQFRIDIVKQAEVIFSYTWLLVFILEIKGPRIKALATCGEDNRMGSNIGLLLYLCEF